MKEEEIIQLFEKSNATMNQLMKAIENPSLKPDMKAIAKDQRELKEKIRALNKEGIQDDKE